MAENLSLYKLIVLYMIDLADGPMTAAHVSDFILGKDYTDYFTLQQSLSELESSSLVNATSTSNATLLEITKKGKETLKFFGDRISQGIRKDVAEFMEANEMTIRNDVSATANFYKTTSGAYAASCRLQDAEEPLLEMTINCKNRTQAEAVCKNWREQSFEVYAYLMDMLMK